MLHIQLRKTDVLIYNAIRNVYNAVRNVYALVSKSNQLT